MLRPLRYNSQPQQATRPDANNPVARGLACYVGLAGRPNADLVDGIPWVVGASATPIAFDAATRGIGLNIKGATPPYVSRPLPAAITSSAAQPVTFRFRLVLRSIASSHGILSWGATSRDGSPRFYVRTNAASQLNFFFAGSYHYATPVLIGREYIVTHTFDGVLHSTYLNGVLVGTSLGAWAANFASFYLGSGFDGPTVSTDFLLSDFGAWNRAMSPAEVRSDADNPYALFAAAPLRLWTTASAPSGGAYSLPAAQAAYTITGNNAGMRVARTLSAAQGSYSITGNPITMKIARRMTAAPGDYSLTGFAIAQPPALILTGTVQFRQYKTQTMRVVRLA